jgi:hypothetical protein
MMHAPISALALVVTIATGPIEPKESTIQMSAQQKNAAVQPLVRSATDCIARTVVADPRFDRQAMDSMLGELIVESMPSCIGQVRVMINAYDRYFGDGTGEAFFTGPYLDVLPTAVGKWFTDSAQ